MEILADRLGFTEGPVVLADGRTAVTSISHGRVYLIAPDGTVESIETGGGPNGLTVGPDGSLYVAQNGGVWGGSGPAEPGVQVIRDGRVDYLVRGLGAPNDLVFGPDGRLWVTDTVSEFDWNAPRTAPAGKVWAIDVATGESSLMVEKGPIFTNGLAFEPSGDLLIGSTLESSLTRYSLRDGKVGPATLAHSFAEGSPDGLAPDGHGRVWAALLQADQVALVDPVQGLVRSLALPEGSIPTNVCLDHDGTSLIVTAAYAESVLRVPLAA